MKKIILSAFAVVALSTSLMAEKNTLPRTVDQSVQAKADKQLKLQNKEIVKLVVEEVGKKLPQTVDQYTQFVDIKSEGLKLLSTFEINTGAKSDEAVIKEDKKRMESIVVRGICHNSKRFLESDIEIAYIYTSAKSKKELFRFDVTAKDCISTWAQN